jgi:phage terminase small subunit
MSSKKVSPKAALSARAARFVEEYLKDLNATAAARRAGYSAKTAGQIAEKLLKDPRIKTAISAALAARSKRARVKADRVIQELEDLALFDPGDVFDFNGNTITLRRAADIPEHARRAISSVKIVGKGAKQRVEVRLCDKSVNLTTLMRHHGLLIDRVKVEDGVSEEELETRVTGLLQRAAARRKAALSGSGA